jgi:HPr kinase/phosphorylase
MPDTLSVQQLYDSHAKRLQLKWLTGEESAQHNIGNANAATPDGLLVGYLNLIRPYRIQVLGKDELDYLNSLGENSRQDSLQRLFSQHPALLIFVDDIKVPDDIVQGANHNQVPVFTSALPGKNLIERLRHNLGTLISDKTTRHGVFMDVMGIGVLLTGPSGIGKSELALELINRGHRLIADDAPEFKRIGPNHLRGTCPELLTNFLEVRGLGLINIRAMFGDNALIRYKRLRLIVDLEPLTDEQIKNIDRLGSTLRFNTIMDVEIPEVVIPVAPGRNIAVIVEAAVRNHVLAMNGYNAADDFMEQQQKLINKTHNEADNH